MAEIKFQCSRCGACCRRAYAVPEIDSTWILPNGSCKHLKDDNSCAIYDKRLDICNSDHYYENEVDKNDISKLEYFISNNMICNQLILEDGMNEGYLIDLDEQGDTTPSS